MSIGNGHFPYLHPIRALVDANQGHPMIMGCLPELELGVMTRKSTGYSQESKETITSSRTPAGLTLDQYASSRTVGFGLRFGNSNISKVIVIIIFKNGP